MISPQVSWLYFIFREHLCWTLLDPAASAPSRPIAFLNVLLAESIPGEWMKFPFSNITLLSHYSDIGWLIFFFLMCISFLPSSWFLLKIGRLQNHHSPWPLWHQSFWGSTWLTLLLLRSFPSACVAVRDVTFVFQNVRSCLCGPWLVPGFFFLLSPSPL